jgi:hypothetical protein
VPGLPDGFPDALVPAAPSRLPDLRPTDAILPAQLASDASAAVHPDEAADAIVPALAAVPCAEKLAVPAPVVPAQDAEEHFQSVVPAEAEVLYTLGAGRSAA